MAPTGTGSVINANDGEDSITHSIWAGFSGITENYGTVTVNCGANDGDQDTISVYMGGAGTGNKAALVKIGQFGSEDVIQARGRSSAVNSFYEGTLTEGVWIVACWHL